MYRWIQPEKDRYYQAHLIEDLFGDWTLVACWGVLHSRQSQMRKTGVPSYEAGLEQLKAIDRRRRQHGYHLIQGAADLPH
ncbi:MULTISPECIES: WGR domain-containing protein [Thiorhodococcus]|uniref:WGR domain-containing protein n=2 Tax=Thiorhodococcus TaxID=57488 RepID=G2E3Z3_9GAMM|nr:WGR domain-containing protein [Thiorhodococcus drewsii]EGV29886.1 hypothetical protein ThidrDRAFT_3006 [Thiorhodococcus drewsii AZ1]